MIARLLVTCALIALTHHSTAETRIYRSVDENGNVVFSDKPPERRSAETIDLKPGNTFSEGRQSTSSNGRQLWIVDEDSSETAEATPSYQRLSILSPAADEAIRANDGSLQVRVELLPELAPTHILQLSFNGNVQAQGTGTVFNLSNIDRGTHIATASVLDDAGNVLITSAPQTFHLLRASR